MMCNHIYPIYEYVQYLVFTAEIYRFKSVVVMNTIVVHSFGIIGTLCINNKNILFKNYFTFLFRFAESNERGY